MAVDEKGVARPDVSSEWDKVDQAFKALMAKAEAQNSARVKAVKASGADKRFPDGFGGVCSKYLLSDSWTLEDAAHLLAGYVPGRPAMGDGDQGGRDIQSMRSLLKAAVNVTLVPVQAPLLGSKRFATRDLLKWAYGKDLKLDPVLLRHIKPTVGTAKRRKRADTVLREKAQEVGLRYYEKVKNRDGSYPVRAVVAKYICNQVEGLQWEEHESKVTEWVKDIDPDRERKREKYGVKG